MLQIDDPGLPAPIAKQLRALQLEVNAVTNYTKRVATAVAAFKRRNKKADSVFSVVRSTLDSMCRGPRRCMYCEDSVADEVEHLAPKNVYPERVFSWLNYCYACGPCNGPKNNKWALFRGASRTPEPFSHPKKKRGAKAPALKPPPAGKAVLLDPRKDEPMELIALDLLDTFELTELAKPGTRAFARANYTITTLGLNRDPLPRARKAAFAAYRALLEEAVAKSSSASEVARIRAEVRMQPHPTVWEEMKRWRAHVTPLKQLFKTLPAALDW